jgi:hypothetical protein
MFNQLYADMKELRNRLKALFPNGYYKYETYKNGSSVTVINFNEDEYVFIDMLEVKHTPEDSKDWVHYKVTRKAL